MATFIYNGTHYGLGENNRDLAYIQAVAEHRFREGRGFPLGIFGTDSKGEFARHFFWMHPSIPVEFLYSPGETVQLDGELFDMQIAATESPFGLLIGEYAADNMPFSFEEANRAKAAKAAAAGGDTES